MKYTSSNVLLNIFETEKINNKNNYTDTIKICKKHILIYILKIYYKYINEKNLYNSYDNTALKIINKVKQNFTFLKIFYNLYNCNTYKNNILKILNLYNISLISNKIFKLYNCIKLITKSIKNKYYIFTEKTNLSNIYKNKIIKIINIYGDKLGLKELNYYYVQLKLLKLKIFDCNLIIKKAAINYLNLKIYNYLLLVLLYISSTTIPLYLIAFA